MNPGHPRVTLRRWLRAWATEASLAGIVLTTIAPWAAAQVGAPVPGVFTQSAPAPAPNRRPAVEEGVHWQKLKPAQRDALGPLQQDWSGIDAVRKQKWLQLSDRMPAMPPDERARVQARMADWAKLTPVERGQARLSYEESRQIPVPDRRSRWEAYQALSPEQKGELAARAAAARGPNGADNPSRRAAGSLARPERAEKAGREIPQAKSNIVPNPAYAAPRRPVGPTVVQAAPGATTTLVTRHPSPPPHQQTGLPKIAATPEFVNKSTLLPQRGAQGAAVRPALPSDAASAGRR